MSVCHRGASALAPENTLLAFDLAMRYRADMSELDVHLSRDGQLMVIHDADLGRLAGRTGHVGDFTAAELAQVDVGSGQRVPRLKDVLQLVRGRMGLYVELKGAGTGAALGALVRDGEAEGVRLVAGSFEPGLVADLRAIAPEVPRSVLFRRSSLAEMLETCRAVGATFAHPCFRPVDRSLVQAFHDAGLLVMTPHSNDTVEIAEFVELGVDVIASDDPRLVVGLSGAQRP